MQMSHMIPSTLSPGPPPPLLTGGRSGPDYTSGLDHVRRVVGEMEHTKKRVEQLAEARKLRLEQFKQLYSCEKDANQVSGSSCDYHVTGM